MACIPKFNYILKALPVRIPPKYFKRFDKFCNKFLWNCNAPGLIYINYKGRSTRVGWVFPIYCYIIMHLTHWCLPPE